MEVVFKGVEQSALSPAQRILWEIDLRLQDGYCILDGINGPCDTIGSGDQDAWTQMADDLAERLAKMPERKTQDRDDFSSKYEREQVLRWLLRALERAGREEETTSVLEREAPHTDCYGELVDRFLAAGETDKAREWARKGFIATQERAPGIAEDRHEDALRWYNAGSGHGSWMDEAPVRRMTDERIPVL